MAGHSHSANIKFRKDRIDGRRARLFSKLARDIAVAAKIGSPDPSANPRLRLAIEKARGASMPKDNIERAINKGAGGGQGENFEEVVYEGYAAGGVAVILDVLTDNRHRTAPEVRKLFDLAGGSLAATGAVSYMFARRAVFAVLADPAWPEERLTEVVLEAGADDLIETAPGFEIHAAPSDFVAVKERLESLGVRIASAELPQVPQTRVEVADEAVARRVMALIEDLEGHEDVQNVYTNIAVSEALATKLGE
jgi:YebC/PmpR family DNA-binding regulatory protein